MSRWHFFHKWMMIGQGHRECVTCHKLQRHDYQLNKWADMGYMPAADYGDGRWLQEYIKQNSAKKPTDKDGK